MPLSRDAAKDMRALGARSILGDPRSPRMQAQMNIKIKFREGFRPFAPSVLREDVADYFDLDEDSPYMLLVADVKRNRRRRMTEEEERLFGIDLDAGTGTFEAMLVTLVGVGIVFAGTCVVAFDAADVQPLALADGVEGQALVRTE